MGTTAVYKRVSSKQQDTRAQSIDLDAYSKQLEANGEAVTEYVDKFTGKSMNRPGWERLYADVCSGKVTKIVIWRLDRLGRTVSGLSQLFEQLIARGVTLVSLRDCLDLSTAAGRLMANVLASVAAYETEVRSERQLAGIEAAQQAIASGEREKYGSGRKQGDAYKLSDEVCRAVRDLKAAGKAIAEIARVVGLSRPTVYVALRQAV
jgi:DNA invertase Pin-like site-specific DNA recombinase